MTEKEIAELDPVRMALLDAAKQFRVWEFLERHTETGSRRRSDIYRKAADRFERILLMAVDRELRPALTAFLRDGVDAKVEAGREYLDQNGWWRFA